MLINHIALKNFKCFKTVDVNLAPITLLTGENSSGKSSLMYGILAPFQSTDFPFYLSPNGKYVHMGDFEEMSFNNSRDNEINIDIGINYFSDGFGRLFKTEWIFNATNGMPKLNHLGYICDSLEFEVEANNNTYNSSHLNEKEKEALRGFTAFFLDVEQDINFIGPFRLHPERTYYQKPKADPKIGRSGEGYIDQILEWELQKAEEFEQLKAILRDLNLLRTIKTKQIHGGRFELNVKVKPKGVWSSLVDVGFGISQFLPVVVADLQLSDISTLLLAQPEIHLHPSVQASLADYFVKQVQETEKQYVIETHSEYLLNRIRLAIVKGTVAAEDVAIYYFESGTEGSLTHQIEFSTDGQIHNAPASFFDTYMIDTMEIALHA